MRSRTRGFTLIEIVIALAVLAIAFFGMISVITYTTRMNLASQQRTNATRAAERKIEQMLNANLFDAGTFAEFSKCGPNDKGLGWDTVDGLEGFRLDDPAFLQMATGMNYAPVVPVAPNGEATLFVRFPLNAAGNGFSEVGTGQFMGNVIYNNPDDPSSGIKGYKDIDLDGDGAANKLSVQLANLTILPVIVDVHWKGASGPKSGTQGHPYVIYRYTFFKKP